MLKRKDASRTTKPRIYVLSIFEVKAEESPPETKRELLKMLKSKKAIPFHKYLCKICHTVPQAKHLHLSWKKWEEIADIMVLHTNEILCPEAVKSVQNVIKLGREQFHSYLADKITDAPHVTSIILDGPAVVEMLKPGGSRTFQEYSTAVFIPYIESQLEYRSRLDLVWDCYLKSGSLKATVRCNRGKGIRRRVTASGPLPSNWQNFLCNSDNKEELFSFQSDRLCSWLSKKVFTVPPRKDTANLAPCNHEEADTRMMVHAADALECGHRRILIRTVDTDVVILAVALANEQSEIPKALGPEKSRALPVFHAITGCDTAAFAGHSKKTAWATWNAFPEVTTAFLSLASTPSEPPDGVLSTPERFIVLYDRTSPCCDVNVLRKKLFSRKSRSMEPLSPTRAALEQHIKRAAYQAGHIWGQAAIAFVSLPSPCDWDWMKSGDELEPLWTTLSEVSKSCHKLISCGGK
ncbi:putative Glycosyl-transferase for dystroglycan-containing protein, partial [Homarus americanus]